MLIQEVKKLDPYQRLCYWIGEREKIRLAKEKGKSKPWTDDVILQSYRFCNVKRMDDKVSKWLLDNWYKPYFDHPNMVVACALARHFNQPSTLEAIGFPDFKPTQSNWNNYAGQALEKIADLKATGITTFNGAYIIRASGEFPNKAVMVFEETCQQFLDDPFYTGNFDTMEHCVGGLMCYRNIGSFMAGQIAADLRWAVKGEFKDKNAWAAIGPGSKKGINIILDRPIDTPISQEVFTVELQRLMKALKQDLPKSITSRLEAIDFQNTLCELSKYTRTLLNEGRPKQKYQGVA